MTEKPVIDRAQDRADAASLLHRLFPLMRSITGPGARASHAILGEIHPLTTIEIPSGTPVLDWTVPPEWRLREAYVEGPDGRRIADAAVNPLHVVNYSVPFQGTLSRAELDLHLYSLPERPTAIPYITSYYARRWGFCLSHQERQALPEGQYRVVVDSQLIDTGSMTLSEIVLPGEEPGEVMFSAYTCHPHMAHDELCGAIALVLLARRLAARPRRRLGVRIVFLPETIGSIAYLATHGETLRRTLAAGYTVANVGRAEPFRYKRSRVGGTVDRAAALALRDHGGDGNRLFPFSPDGSDERQYCSPGFNLPFGALWRGEMFFPEYHCSLDTPDLVPIDAVIETVDLLERLVDVHDGNHAYENLKPHGEPQLGRYGLYPTIGSTSERSNELLALLWVLNQSDGSNDLIAVAETSGYPFERILKAAQACEQAGLLARTGNVRRSP